MVVGIAGREVQKLNRGNERARNKHQLDDQSLASVEPPYMDYTILDEYNPVRRNEITSTVSSQPSLWDVE